MVSGRGRAGLPRGFCQTRLPAFEQIALTRSVARAAQNKSEQAADHRRAGDTRPRIFMNVFVRRLHGVPCGLGGTILKILNSIF